jgi:hypothetical protein
MGKIMQQRAAEARTEARAPEAIARRLLNVIVYDRSCRVGDKLTLDNLIETTDIGEWKMSAFEAARTHAVAQGWLVIEGDSMRLTIAGSAAA